MPPARTIPSSRQSPAEFVQDLVASLRRLNLSTDLKLGATIGLGAYADVLEGMLLMTSTNERKKVAVKRFRVILTLRREQKFAEVCINLWILCYSQILTRDSIEICTRAVYTGKTSTRECCTFARNYCCWWNSFTCIRVDGKRYNDGLHWRTPHGRYKSHGQYQQFSLKDVVEQNGLNWRHWELHVD